MTPRTLGLFSTIGVLSVSAFTAFLVLAYPNPNVSNAVSGTPANSDTKFIDSTRTIANISSRNQTRSNNSGPLGTTTQSRESEQDSGTASAEPSTQNNSQADSASQASSTQPAQQSAQTQAPHNQSRSQPAQQAPPVVNLVESALKKVVSVFTGA